MVFNVESKALLMDIQGGWLPSFLCFIAFLHLGLD